MRPILFYDDRFLFFSDPQLEEQKLYEKYATYLPVMLNDPGSAYYDPFGNFFSSMCFKSNPNG